MLRFGLPQSATLGLIESMRITTVFQIHPPYIFGLPDGQKVVQPDGMQATVQLDGRTGMVVSRPTVSQYRANADAISEKLKIGPAELQINDDYARITVTSQSPQDGYVNAVHLMTRFLRHLMIGSMPYFSAIPIQIEADDETAIPVKGFRTLFEAASYSLESLRHGMRVAAKFVSIEDPRANRSLMYFEHARYLINSVHTHPDPHSLFVKCSAFLYFWKSLTSVLGDPANDKDHQTRYCQLGFPREFWNTRVKPMKLLRDSADVAHHNLEPDRANLVVDRLNEIDDLCREVITRYREHLTPECPHQDKDEG